MGAWSLSHWTTSEVPQDISLSSIHQRQGQDLSLAQRWDQLQSLQGWGKTKNAGRFAQHVLRVPKWWPQSPELSWALPPGGSEGI